MNIEKFILKERRHPPLCDGTSDYQRLRSTEHYTWGLIIFFMCSLCSPLGPFARRSIYGVCLGIAMCLFLIYLYARLFRVIKARDYFESRGPQSIEDVRKRVE